MHIDIISGLMINVPSGQFLMGSDDSQNERPSRLVSLSAYYIDKYPVTNAQYQVFIGDEGYERAEFWTTPGWAFIKERKLQHPLYWLDDHWNEPDQPVTGVSWWEALAYARYAGKSLPTEAQWECAARGRDGCRFPWGPQFPSAERANYAVDCDPTELRRKSTAVHAFPLGASPWNCMDMAGNVGEWCMDNASNNYSWDITCRNPRYWVSEQDDHIVRGGSGLHNEDYLRCSSRDYYPPTLRDNIVGLRCVINTEE